MNRGVLKWYEASSKAFVHDGQNQLRLQRQLFTVDRSRYVFNEFCSRQIKSYKSVNRNTIRVPVKKNYLITINRGVRNKYETSSKVFVHDGQNRLSFQRQLFIAGVTLITVTYICKYIWVKGLVILTHNLKEV